MPKKRSARRYAAPLQLRVTPEQLHLFRQAAEQDGRPLSNWARDRLERLARQELSAEPRRS